MWTLASRPRIALAALLLWALNAWICWPLFGIEYLDQFQSNEGSFITFATFLRTWWPHVRWFPLFNCGVPYEATYLPLVPALAAIGGWLTGCSSAHAFHFVAALAYSFAPVSLFLFAHKLSARLAPSFAAGLLWSLFSPSVVIASVRADVGSPIALRRLQTVVYYGEVPHNVALCLAPLALLAVYRYLEAPRARRFAVAVLAVASVMLSNAFGMVLIAVSSLILVAVVEKASWRRYLSIAALLFAAYALICRLIPPWLLGVIHTNSQQVGGDFRFTAQAYAIGAAFVLLLLVLWRLVLRLSDPLLRFSILYLGFFGGITVMAVWDVYFVPQPQRYHLEMETGICLVVACAASHFRFERFSRLARVTLAAFSAIVLIAVSAADFQYARRLIRPADLDKSFIVHEARWTDTHFPAERVMVSGEAGFWFDNFARNPQLGGGHDPTDPNWVQRVAVYTIYSGENAGAQDGSISVLWLKAFDCAAIVVPGLKSADFYRPIRNPQKFDGLLPLAWREGDDSIYQVPLHSVSLAHVIPASAVVTRRPIHGLDTAGVATYVDALDREAAPTDLTWLNPERGRIAANVAPGQVISVQVSYDPDWRATLDDQPVAIAPDQLGMMVLTPPHPGRYILDLAFIEGRERAICSIVSILTALSLLLATLWDKLYSLPPFPVAAPKTR